MASGVIFVEAGVTSVGMITGPVTVASGGGGVRLAVGVSVPVGCMVGTAMTGAGVCDEIISVLAWDGVVSMVGVGCVAIGAARAVA